MAVYGQVTIGGTPAFPVFRACGGLLVIHWCWGISTLVWNRFRINYIYLFEFDPRTVNSSFTILNEAVDETLVFLIIMLLYYKACIGAMPHFFSPGWFPFALVAFTFKCLLTPWRVRKGLWVTILAVVQVRRGSSKRASDGAYRICHGTLSFACDGAWRASFVHSAYHKYRHTC